MVLKVFVKLSKGMVVMGFSKAEFWMGFEQCLCRYCFFFYIYQLVRVLKENL